jgi:hypothetical protein
LLLFFQKKKNLLLSYEKEAKRLLFFARCINGRSTPVAWARYLSLTVPWGLCPGETRKADTALPSHNDGGRAVRGILLWVLGIPIPVIILLYLFHVI